MSRWDKVYVREKVHLVTNIYDFLIKTKEELYGISPVWAMGNAGEKYLHIPVVTWYNVQVGIKCPVTNLEWSYWQHKYLVNRVSQSINRKWLLTLFTRSPYFLKNFTNTEICLIQGKNNLDQRKLPIAQGAFTSSLVSFHVGFSACICLPN